MSAPACRVSLGLSSPASFLHHSSREKSGKKKGKFSDVCTEPMSCLPQVSCFQQQMPTVSFFAQFFYLAQLMYNSYCWVSKLPVLIRLSWFSRAPPSNSLIPETPSSGRCFGDKQHMKVLKIGSRWTSFAPERPLWESLRFSRLINPPWGLLLVIKTAAMEFGWLWQRVAMNSMPASNPVHATELLSKAWCAQGLAPQWNWRDLLIDC